MELCSRLVVSEQEHHLSRVPFTQVFVCLSCRNEKLIK